MCQIIAVDADVVHLTAIFPRDVEPVSFLTVASAVPFVSAVLLIGWWK